MPTIRRRQPRAHPRHADGIERTVTPSSPSERVAPGRRAVPPPNRASRRQPIARRSLTPLRPRSLATACPEATRRLASAGDVHSDGGTGHLLRLREP